METWEEIDLRLARQAGIATPQHTLLNAAGKAVIFAAFDVTACSAFLSVTEMALMGASDGERGSYSEIVDALAQHGAQTGI